MQVVKREKESSLRIENNRKDTGTTVSVPSDGLTLSPYSKWTGILHPKQIPINHIKGPLWKTQNLLLFLPTCPMPISQTANVGVAGSTGSCGHRMTAIAARATGYLGHLFIWIYAHWEYNGEPDAITQRSLGCVALSIEANHVHDIVSFYFCIYLPLETELL